MNYCLYWPTNVGCLPRSMVDISSDTPRTKLFSLSRQWSTKNSLYFRGLGFQTPFVVKFLSCRSRVSAHLCMLPHFFLSSYVHTFYFVWHLALLHHDKHLHNLSIFLPLQLFFWCEPPRGKKNVWIESRRQRERGSKLLVSREPKCQILKTPRYKLEQWDKEQKSLIKEEVHL